MHVVKALVYHLLRDEVCGSRVHGPNFLDMLTILGKLYAILPQNRYTDYT